MLTSLAVSAVLILVVAASRLAVRRGRHEVSRGLLGRVRGHHQQVPAARPGVSRTIVCGADGVSDLRSCTTWLKTSTRPGTAVHAAPWTVTLVM